MNLVHIVRVRLRDQWGHEMEVALNEEINNDGPEVWRVVGVETGYRVVP